MQALTAQLEEYKIKLTALAEKAGLADTLAAQLSALETEKAEFTATIEGNKAVIEAAVLKATEDKAKIEELESKISAMETEKKSSDEKALEMVASLGLNVIPVITVTETDKPSAESIRQKYMAITDSVEKAKFYAENKAAILNGVLE